MAGKGTLRARVDRDGTLRVRRLQPSLEATMHFSGLARFANPAAVAAAAILVSACASLILREPLNATLSSFAPAELGVFEQRYDIRMRLQNPNDADLAFDGATLNLEINGKAFANGVSAEKGVVPRFGETVISFSAVSGLGGILRQVGDYQSGARQGFSYRITGRLHGSGPGGTPFESAGEFKLAPGNF